MQPQGNIGIFSRIGGRLLQFNLVEGQLLDAFARDLFEGHGLDPQILGRQIIHIVPGRRGVQHIGFEHGVEGNAPQFDAMIAQHVAIKLQILAYLTLAGIF